MRILCLLVACFASTASAGSHDAYKHFTTEQVGINCTQPDHQLDNKILNDFIIAKGQFRFEVKQTSSDPFMDKNKPGGVVYGTFAVDVFDRNSDALTPLFSIKATGERAGSWIIFKGTNASENSIDLSIILQTNEFDDQSILATGSINGSTLSFDCDPFYAF